MDGDHERILLKINALLESIDFHSGQPNHEMRTQLDKLIVMTRTHFDREVAEMKRINYTASSAHRAEHSALLIEIAAFRAALDANEKIDCAGVQDFFSKWWCAHILGADMRLAAELEGSTVS
jgi:hemerythrin-like metal-binding protein